MQSSKLLVARLSCPELGTAQPQLVTFFLMLMYCFSIFYQGGGVRVYLLFFINFCNILNFFFADIKFLFIVEFTALKNAILACLFAMVD